MEQHLRDLGLQTMSEYVRYLHRSHVEQVSHETTPVPTAPAYPKPEVLFETTRGRVLHGDSLGLLHHQIDPKSVDLIMTSPPFGLVRKKSYGNEDATSYLKWFRPFAEGFKRVLKDSGSLVIDIGGSWNPGAPTRSLYHFDLLIMLCREFGFHLCQEHYWWNPSKLPTPAEWVNVRRVRVKDAINCVWWLSPTPWPKANNKRVLAPYSDAMHDLLKNGYKPALRPSGHDISNKFGRDNGGSVPPNLLAVANTESNGRYQDFCREHNLPIHPARYPAGVPGYFIRLLTDVDDNVVDPFAGSCVTGEVCEALGRNWTCCDSVKDYLEGARARFQGEPTGQAKRQSNEARTPECRCPSCAELMAPDWIKGQAKKLTPDSYSISAPVVRRVDETTVPLFMDGGKTRPDHIKRHNGRNGTQNTRARQASAISFDNAISPV